MTYSVEYSEKEDIKYLKAYYSYAFLKYHIKSRVYESTAAGIVAFIVLQIRGFELKKSFYISLMAMLIMFLIDPYYNILKGFILMKWRGKGVPKKEIYEVDLNESGIKFSSNTGESLWKWDQIEKITKYRDFILFEMRNKRLFRIPVNGFTSADMFEDFSRQIDQRFRKPT